VLPPRAVLQNRPDFLNPRVLPEMLFNPNSVERRLAMRYTPRSAWTRL
jgi:hypothetical protein